MKLLEKQLMEMIADILLVKRHIFDSLEKLYDIDRTIFPIRNAAEKRLSELKVKEEECDYER